MTYRRITIRAYDRFESGLLERISAEVEQSLKIPAKIEEKYMDLSPFYDPSRRQYDANGILSCIDGEFPEGSLKMIGLFKIDLFIPILTFIYGQGYLDGRTAVASLFRLSNERYGIPENEQVLLERFSKEVIHELGHTFGLKHCHVPGCVMTSSTYVEDIDQKTSGFCRTCQSQLFQTESH